MGIGWNSALHPRGTGGQFSTSQQGQVKNKTVEAIQKLLGIKVDGVFGPATKAAVMKYQKDHGLQADGIVGHQTASSLTGKGPKQKVGNYAGNDQKSLLQAGGVKGGLSSSTGTGSGSRGQKKSIVDTKIAALPPGTKYRITGNDVVVQPVKKNTMTTGDMGGAGEAPTTIEQDGRGKASPWDICYRCKNRKVEGTRCPHCGQPSQGAKAWLMMPAGFANVQKGWTEGAHPRGYHGKWIASKGDRVQFDGQHYDVLGPGTHDHLVRISRTDPNTSRGYTDVPRSKVTQVNTIRMKEDSSVPIRVRKMDQEPLGTKPLWHRAGLHLPPYVQHIAHDLMDEQGMEESHAIATAISRCKVWAAGGQHVHPDTQAKAAAAIAEWEKDKAGSIGKAMAGALIEKGWTEALHLRGYHGKFAPEGGRGSHAEAKRPFSSHVGDTVHVGPKSYDLAKIRAMEPHEGHRYARDAGHQIADEQFKRKMSPEELQTAIHHKNLVMDAALESPHPSKPSTPSERRYKIRARGGPHPAGHRA